MIFAFIKFNAVLEYKQAGCLIMPCDDVISRQRKQIFGFALLRYDTIDELNVDSNAEYTA